MQRPFEAGRPEGRARLAALLRGTMIRAAKSAIRDIPTCLRKVGAGCDYVDLPCCDQQTSVVTRPRAAIRMLLHPVPETAGQHL